MDFMAGTLPGRSPEELVREAARSGAAQQRTLTWTVPGHIMAVELPEGNPQHFGIIYQGDLQGRGGYTTVYAPMPDFGKTRELIRTPQPEAIRVVRVSPSVTVLPAGLPESVAEELVPAGSGAVHAVRAAKPAKVRAGPRSHGKMWVVRPLS